MWEAFSVFVHADFCALSRSNPSPPEKAEDPPVEHEVRVFLKDPVGLHQPHADHKVGISIKENGHSIPSSQLVDPFSSSIYFFFSHSLSPHVFLLCLTFPGPVYNCTVGVPTTDDWEVPLPAKICSQAPGKD